MVTAQGGVAYLQEFVPHSGHDLRALVVGERVFGMRRDAAAGGWVTNLAQGGTASPAALDQNLEILAIRAATALGATLAGVDLLPSLDGRTFVIEVNGVPGWRGIERVHGPSIGKAIADHLADRAFKNG
jgi:glutathione synthase/RimK-type ligase-like ATP-grasp enzyme